MPHVCNAFISKLNMNDAEISLLERKLKEKTKAFDVLKDMDAKIAELEKGERAPELRKARAEQSRILNDVSDEITADYDKIAKSMVKNQDNLRAIHFNTFKDAVTKNPKKLEDGVVFLSHANKDSWYGKSNEVSNDFKSLMNGYEDSEGAIPITAENSTDDAMRDMSNPLTEHIVGYVRKWVDNTHMSVMGRRYFEDDLDHMTDIQADRVSRQISKNSDVFKTDILTACDHEKLTNKWNEQRHSKDTDIKGFDEAGEESATGAARKRAESKTLEQMLDDIVEAKKRGRGMDGLSLSTLPFKSNKHYVDFIKKYSGRSPMMAYINHASNGFIKRMVYSSETGGYDPYFLLKSMPDEAFHDTGIGFTRTKAKDYIDMFLGSGEATTVKKMNVLKWIGDVQEASLVSKGLTTPIYSVVDVNQGGVMEALKNNHFNSVSGVRNAITEMLSNSSTRLVHTAKNIGAVGKGALKVLQRQQVNKVYEMTRSYSGAMQVRMLEDMNNVHSSKLMRTISTWNKKAIFNIQHEIDQISEYATWEAMTNTLRRYDPKKPIKLTERLHSMGFDDSDIMAVKKHIRDTHCKAIDIQNIGSKDLQKKLNLLKLNTDNSAIPMDITPIPLGSLNSPAMSKIFRQFMGFHHKTISGVLGALQEQEGVMGKASAGAFYAAGVFVPNLVMNSLMTYAYTGKDPFSKELFPQTVVGSLLGGISKPAMIAYSYLSANTRELGMQLSNPLVSMVGATFNVGAGAYDYATSYHMAQDSQKFDDKIFRAVMKYVPAGSGIQAASKHF